MTDTSLIEVLIDRCNLARSPFSLSSLKSFPPACHRDFIEALEEALACPSQPEIVNSEESSPFTSTHFVKVLKAADIAISMDGKRT